jgi:hypothetical protein
MVVDIQDVADSDWSMTLSPEGQFTFSCTLNSVTFGYTVEKFYSEVDVPSAKMHYNKRNFSIIIDKTDKKSEKWPRLRSTMHKHPCFSVDWDRWEDSDAEEEPDPNKAHWNAGMHRALTGGPNGGIDVE